MDTSVVPPVAPSITLFRRQFLRMLFPILLAFLLFIIYRIFISSLTLRNTSSFLTWSVQLIFSVLLQHHISKLSRYFSVLLSKVSKFQHHTDRRSARNVLLVSFFNFRPNLLVEKELSFFFLMVVFVMAILDLVPFVHLASYVIMLPKYLKYSTFSGFSWSIRIYNVDNCNGVLVSLDFLTFISIP